MTRASEFWDALAPHHAAIENSYLDLASLRRILSSVHRPVLVVGAGQGLLVKELRDRCFQCEGVDFSPQMIRQAKLRRGLDLVEADAKVLPFGAATYSTIIYATGVIDFMADEQEIRAILSEGKRVVKPTGNTFVAFYRLSRAGEEFIAKVGLLENNSVSLRRSLELYLLNPAQMVAWVANHARISRFKAALVLFWFAMRNTTQEKVMTFRMQKIFRDPEVARALLGSAAEKQPYRNEAEVRNLFQRLAIPIRRIQPTSSCHLVEI